MGKKWVAFFSQTGQEIADLSGITGRWPDVIVSNWRPGVSRVIDQRIPISNYVLVRNRPTSQDYKEIFDEFAGDSLIITLHGWLRIVPADITKKYPIWNGHPGLITKYPELKGKDPQLRAYKGKYETAGCVLHEVIPEVDEGKIVDSCEFPIKDLSLDEVYEKCRQGSLELWERFFKTV